jgi:hypothetical protein
LPGSEPTDHGPGHELQHSFSERRLHAGDSSHNHLLGHESERSAKPGECLAVAGKNAIPAEHWNDGHAAPEYGSHLPGYVGWVLRLDSDELRHVCAVRS